jgi:hypothetical protein
MISNLPYSVLALFIMLLGGILLFGCDKCTRTVGLSAMSFQGDATLEYLEKPGVLGSKGVQLSFERFSLGNGIDRTYIFKNIPELKQPYRLYFMPDTQISNDLSTNILITAVLEDSKGTQQWRVESLLSHWRVSETVGKTEHFYMLSTKTGIIECAFVPSPNTKYGLHITCKVLKPDLIASVTNTNVRFSLRAGGYK